MHITSISGSPSERSRSAWLTQFALTRLEGIATSSEHIAVRALPAAALLAADAQEPAIAQAVDAIASASLVIVGTPIYKAAYSGLLKSLLDLLPQYAFAGKAVLPLALGGSPAHVLAIDYALRPVLTSMGARHVVQGYFLVDRLVTLTDDGGIVLDPGADEALRVIVDGFGDALSWAPPGPAPAITPTLAATG